MTDRASQRILRQRLADHRSKRVVFLAHCLLNENTRYLGGACRAGCVREIVEQCVAGDMGIVQMPCPEQQAWGGVLKRRLLATYGAQGTWFYRCRGLLLPLLLAYTRWVYQRLAAQIARQIPTRSAPLRYQRPAHVAPDKTVQQEPPALMRLSADGLEVLLMARPGLPGRFP